MDSQSPSNDDGITNVKSCTITKSPQYLFNHIWNIQNFADTLSELTGDEPAYDKLSSTEFTGGESSTWYLEVHVDFDEDDESCLNISLVLQSAKEDEEHASISANFQFSILDANEQPLWEFDKLHHNFMLSSDDENQSSIRIRLDDFFNPHPHNPKLSFVDGDQLRIRCQVWMCGKIRKVKLGNEDDEKEEDKKVPLDDLRIDFKKLFMESSFHDVLVATSAQTFKAHKAILSARSSVFSAMFNTEMVEAANGVITINDFNDGIVKDMLHYIYCGEIEDLTDATILDVFRIADKYDIKGLQEKCVKKIPSILCKDNVIDILVSIDLYELVNLKSLLMEYIIKNIKGVKKTKAFNNLVNVNGALLMEIFHKLF